MGRARPSLLHRLLNRPAAALSNWLLASRRRAAALVRDQLVDSLVAVMPSSLEEDALELAIVEGVLAISLADGSFAQEEWELYASTLAQLKLSDEQLQSISLQDSPDLRRIATSLATLQNPSHRLEIARCFCLFAAADGEQNEHELGTIRTLLQALDHPELEQELPALCRRFRRSETWWQRQCGALGERLARWASPHRRR
jgi:uncharacterized tellurite resistance protein B-like protein